MKHSTRFLLLHACILFTLVLVTSTCTPQTTAPPLVSATPYPVQSATPSQKETGQPPLEITPSVGPIKVPQATLSSSGPWLIYLSEEGIVAVNADGTGRTLLTPPPLPGIVAKTFDLPNGISPDGGLLALRTARSEPPGWDLSLLKLPDGQLQVITPLLSDELESDLSGTLDIDVENAIFWETNALRWSPEGRYLAFVAALDGPSSDLYVYDTLDGSVRRLTSGNNQAATPIWSSDGEWIIHQEVQTFGSGAGWSVNAVWAAAVDGSAIRKLYEVPEYDGPDQFYGSTLTDELLVHRFSQSNPELHITDLNNGHNTILQEGFPDPDSVALDPNSGAVAFTSGGLYLRLPGGEEASVIDERPWFGVIWSEGFEQFFAHGDAGVIGLRPNGESTIVNQDPAPPWPSPDGNWMALSGDPLRLYNSNWELVQEFPTASYADVIWRPDSVGLFLLKDKSLHYLPVPDGQPALVDTALQVRYDFPLRDLRGIGWAVDVDLKGTGEWLLLNEEDRLVVFNAQTRQSLSIDEPEVLIPEQVKIANGRIFWFSPQDNGLFEVLHNGLLRNTGIDLDGLIFPSTSSLTKDGGRLIWYRAPTDWSSGEIEVLESNLDTGISKSLAILSPPENLRDRFADRFVYPFFWFQSPDEGTLYFAWHPEAGGMQYVTGGQFSLYRMDIETGQSEALVPLSETLIGKIDAALSPDGLSLAYLQIRSNLWELVVQDTLSDQKSIYPLPDDTVDAGRIIFSPDGHQLALTIAQADEPPVISSVIVFEILTGQQQTIYTGSEAGEGKPLLETRAWTEGGWIILANTTSMTHIGTWVIRPGGDKPTNISNLEFLGLISP